MAEKSLMDWVLPNGKTLGESTAPEIAETIEFLVRILQAMPDKDTTAEVIEFPKDKPRD